MNKIVKFQLVIFAVITTYAFIRIIGASDISLTFWQKIYWGNVFKDSFLMIIYILIIYAIFNIIRFNPKTGPTIIKGNVLKKTLYFLIAIFWMTVITRMFSDSFKIIFPFNKFKLYQFADLLDETLGHIFLYVPIIAIYFIGTLLEIERPSKKSLAQLEILLIFILSILAGIGWGLNLTEGNFSAFTSLPLMLIFLIFSAFIFIKHKLKLNYRPWSLSFLVIYTFGSLTFISYGLIFKSFPQIFTLIK